MCEETGIWQTVWLEKLPKNHVDKIFIYPDVDNTRVRISAHVVGNGKLNIKATYEGKTMGEASVNAVTGQVDVIIDLAEEHLWEIGVGRLYDLDSMEQDFMRKHLNQDFYITVTD